MQVVRRTVLYLILGADNGGAVGRQGRDDVQLKMVNSMLSEENSDLYEDISEYVCTEQLQPVLAKLPETQRIIIEGTYGLNGSCLTSREVRHRWPSMHRAPFVVLPQYNAAAESPAHKPLRGWYRAHDCRSFCRQMGFDSVWAFWQSQDFPNFGLLAKCNVW